jgi:DNA-binding NarL/FixJ family response regulator
MTSRTTSPPADHAGQPLSVISVDDNPMIGEVIGLMIADQPDLHYVRHFVSGAGVLDQVRQQGIGLVVLDYEIPGTDTLALLRQIVAACPDCRVMMLSAHGRREIVEGCRKSGASGYVLKTDAPEVIIESLRHVATADEFFTGPGLPC